MQTYVDQLLDDIQKGHRPFKPGQRRYFNPHKLPAPDNDPTWIENPPLINPDEDYPESSPEEVIKESEKMVSGDYGQTISYFTGLKKDQFPPANKLTKVQMTDIKKAFDNMIESWNVVIHLPSTMPIALAYQHTVNLIAQPLTPGNKGWWNALDFCSGYAPDCELGEYCSCRDVLTKDIKAAK